MRVRKLFAVLVVLTFVLACAIPAFAEGQVGGGVDNSNVPVDDSPWPMVNNIQVVVDGKFYNLDPAPRFITGGRVGVPCRALAEALGAWVAWDGKLKKVTLTKGDRVATLFIDKKVMYVYSDGETKTVNLDVAPILINGRTFVPLRAAGEALNYYVSWDEDIQTAYLNTIK
ncbi:MAG: copper amine oxidase N-terminal domain-containing protein [Desulfotomaculales bacterium]